MITRDVGTAPWRATCAGAPPGLDVASDHEGARWYPLPRVVLFPQPPGPQAVTIPTGPGQATGDDPTNPAAQTVPRFTTWGMMPWLDAHAQVNIGQSGGRK